MDFKFIVTCSAQRTTGKMASREDILEEIRGAIEGADPQTLTPGESEYDIADWLVEEDPVPTLRQMKKLRRRIDARNELIRAVLAITPTEPTLLKAVRRYQRLNAGDSNGQT